MSSTPPATDSELRAGPRKREAVAEISGKLRKATSAVLTDYRGISVAELQELRTKLRQEGVEYVVVKNTLARRAAKSAGVDDFAASFTGPIGVAFGYDELSTPARLVNDFFKATKQLPIVGGWIDGRVLDATTVKQLADLPSRDALLAQLAGTLQSPLTQLAGSLNSILSNFAAALDAYRTKLEAA